jgi:thioredoxin reductase
MPDAGVSYDVIIAGGGPAGLSAALVLGRCRRRVLVCDAGHPRNAVSHGMHGYLTRDCVEPAEFLRIAREQLAPYGVELRHATVKSACKPGEHFEVRLEDETTLSCRMLLIATGVVDELPPVPRIRDFYGSSVFHCPYCDGWEMRDQPVAVYGRGKNGAGLALDLKTWTSDVVLCTDGPARLGALESARLARHGVPVMEHRITGLEGSDGVLERIAFAGAEPLARRAIFFSTGQRQSCELARLLGCEFNHKGSVRTNRLEGTNVEGLYVAGDASRDMQFVIVAAAEGAKAAVAINKALQKREHS